MVLVSALAEPKAGIFQSLSEILKKRGHASVVFRTYTGMRAILYEPVKPGDIEGMNYPVRLRRGINPKGFNK
jgi:hypothetical protein